MSKSRKTRLAYLGEWASPEAVSGILRPMFLHVLSDLVPEVLFKLREDVLPLYERACAQGRLTLADLDPAPGPTRPLPKEESLKAPKTLRMVLLEELERSREPAPLFTEEEAAKLHEQGYDLIAVHGPEVKERFFIWRPQGWGEERSGLAPSGHAGGDELRAQLAELRDALGAWALSWNLKEDWFLCLAFRQLELWQRSWYLAHPHVHIRRERNNRTSTNPMAHLWQGTEPDRKAEDMIGPSRLTWHVHPNVTWYLLTSPEERRFTFIHEGWDPSALTKSEARLQMRDDFAQKLEEYLDCLERQAQSLGDQVMHTPRLQLLHNHLTWLVRYQCRGESLPSIARQDHYHRQAVSDAVRQVARQLGVTLRPPRPGRPPGRRRHLLTS